MEHQTSFFETRLDLRVHAILDEGAPVAQVGLVGIRHKLGGEEGSRVGVEQMHRHVAQAHRVVQHALRVHPLLGAAPLDCDEVLHVVAAQSQWQRQVAAHVVLAHGEGELVTEPTRAVAVGHVNALRQCWRGVGLEHGSVIAHAEQHLWLVGLNELPAPVQHLPLPHVGLGARTGSFSVVLEICMVHQLVHVPRICRIIHRNVGVENNRDVAGQVGDGVLQALEGAVDQSVVFVDLARRAVDVGGLVPGVQDQKELDAIAREDRGVDEPGDLGVQLQAPDLPRHADGQLRVLGVGQEVALRLYPVVIVDAGVRHPELGPLQAQKLRQRVGVDDLLREDVHLRQHVVRHHAPHQACVKVKELGRCGVVHLQAVQALAAGRLQRQRQALTEPRACRHPTLRLSQGQHNLRLGACPGSSVEVEEVLAHGGVQQKLEVTQHGAEG
mmetsp:Transcript_93853/g.223196  ORF Transcript_93853/g.223196 Transcript_93853/m.223196 type:complete len:441 (-) Transcript_93853:529-1851(-)